MIVILIFVAFIIGLIIGRKASEIKPKGSLRIVRDEDGESFIFLEFYSREDKLSVETLNDNQFVTFRVSHK